MERDEQKNASSVEMPAPTFWPMVFAFGLTLLGAGLVTHYLISTIGLVIGIRAALGWWGVVIPHEEHEMVPLRPPELRAAAVVTTGRSVARLKVGEGHHRMRVPETVHPYTAGIWGGLAGGLAMAVLACGYGQIAYQSIWYPVNLLAAIAIPSVSSSSIEALRQFNAVAFSIALVTHGLVSILVGVLYAVTLPMFPRRAPLWAGFIVPLFWTALLAGTLSLTNPALNQRVNWFSFVLCQLGFGLVAGFVAAKTQRIDTMQNLPFVERAAVEGQFRREEEDGENS